MLQNVLLLLCALHTVFHSLLDFELPKPQQTMTTHSSWDSHHVSMQALTASHWCRIQSAQSDSDLFPETHAQPTDATEKLDANIRQADSAANTEPDRTAKRPGAESQGTAQQQHVENPQQKKEPEPAAEAVQDSSWRSTLRNQLTAASGILSSSLHSASGDAGGESTPRRRKGRGRNGRNKKQPTPPPKTFPWVAKMVEKTICNDSCHKAVSRHLTILLCGTMPASAELFWCQLDRFLSATGLYASFERIAVPASGQSAMKCSIRSQHCCSALLYVLSFCVLQRILL